MTLFSSDINLNLPQTPRELNPEINVALIPVYNAIRLIQQYLQGTTASVTTSGINVASLEEIGRAHV